MLKNMKHILKRKENIMSTIFTEPKLYQIQK